MHLHVVACACGVSINNLRELRGTSTIEGMIKGRWGLALFLLAVGCGDDGGSVVPADAMPDAPRQCSAVTAQAFDLYDFDDGYVAYAALLDGTIDGNGVYYRFEFYSDIEPSLSGTFDLAAGNQANYQTCAICVRGFEYSGQNVVKSFFQSAGTISLSMDPLTAKHFTASVTGLRFEEVTIDQTGTFHSTPVAGGACADVADNSIDHDQVPNDWTCSPRSDFAAGTGCNCNCGVYDPDCDNAAAAITGCPNSYDSCSGDGSCVTLAPANETCVAATALTINAAAVTGRTVAASSNYDMGLEGAGCTNAAQPGADVVYKVTLTASTAYTISLTNLSSTFDGSLSLVGPGAATLCDASPIATCVKGADAGAQGATETLTFTPSTGGDYFIIVDSKESAGTGTFSIAITST